MDSLQECVAFFAKGGVGDWVIGGGMVAILVAFAFMKRSVPEVIKLGLGQLLNLFGKKKQ